MKKSVDIIGLPVVSITEGKEVGKVKRLVIDAAQGKVVAVVVDDTPKWYLGARLLPMQAVAGIGEYAVTVETISDILTMEDIAGMEALLEADIRTIGTKVITKSGRIQGKVTEITINDDGRIISCEIEEPSGEAAEIPAERVITFGKEMLVIAEEGEVKPANQRSMAKPPVLTVKQSSAVESVQSSPPAKDVQQEEEPPAPQPSAPVSSPDDSAKKFDDKHRKYLLGKKASRRIETDNGMLIVEQGGEITEEVLQKARLAGKFVELSMNIQ